MTLLKLGRCVSVFVTRALLLCTMLVDGWIRDSLGMTDIVRCGLVAGVVASGRFSGG